MEVARHAFRANGASAKLIIDSDGTATVRNLYSHYKGRGEARAVMESIVAFLERNDLVCFLEARPYGRPEQGLSLESLIVFYKKFEFELDPKYSKGTWMYRVPARYLNTNLSKGENYATEETV